MLGDTDPVPTLMRALGEAARRWPQRGITVQSHRRRAERRCYPEVLAAAQRAAGLLAAAGVRHDDRVLLALQTSWPLLDFWFGALLLNARPVAAAPPLPLADTAVATERLEALGRGLRVSLLITSELPGVIGSRAVSPGALYALAPHRVVAPAPEAEDIAFLQLTSGTEGTPRAASISHRAVLYNTRALHTACGPGINRVVSWLPLHHDMGLVGALLLAVVAGCELVLLTPPVFLAWPDLWFGHIADGGSVLSLAPNFALQFCLDRRAQIGTGLDLSGWRALVCGGEMLRAETLTGFAATFSLPVETLRPGYGLAEATLAVTLGAGTTATRPAPTHAARRFALHEVVSAGRPLPGTEVRIADDAAEGEVLVRGPGLFSGYFGDPATTAAAVPHGWLRTGDLGLVDDGALYLTGRLRETLNLRGSVTSPHELEWIAEALTGGGGRRRAAAFAVATDAGGERAVLVVEVDAADGHALPEIESAIRTRVSLALGVRLGDLVLLRRGQLPRTSSGKIRRAAARERYLGGRLEPAV